jgi:hypothetical protein
MRFAAFAAQYLLIAELHFLMSAGRSFLRHRSSSMHEQRRAHATCEAVVLLNASKKGSFPPNRVRFVDLRYGKCKSSKADRDLTIFDRTHAMASAASVVDL